MVNQKHIHVLYQNRTRELLRQNTGDRRPEKRDLFFHVPRWKTPQGKAGIPFPGILFQMQEKMEKRGGSSSSRAH